VGASRTLISLDPLFVGEPSHDGSRFIVAVLPEEHARGQLTLMVNWAQASDQP
jgi:hypothetical protein